MQLLIALLWSVSAAQAPAPAPAQLPPAKQILDRYIEVTGGRAAYEKAKHRTLTGTSAWGWGWGTLPPSSRPPQMTTRSVPGLGRSRGTDGTHAWE
jgi:hypothetical protein